MPYDDLPPPYTPHAPAAPVVTGQTEQPQLRARTSGGGPSPASPSTPRPVRTGSITLGPPEDYSPLPYPPPSRRLGSQNQTASQDMSDDEDTTGSGLFQEIPGAMQQPNSNNNNSNDGNSINLSGIVPGVPVYRLRSPIQPKEFLKGVSLALEGCFVALTNPNFRHGRLYKTLLRLLLFTLIAHIVTQIVFFLPIMIMGNILKVAGFALDTDTRNSQRGLEMFSLKAQELMSSIPLLGLLFLRYLYPQPLDDIFMEGLAYSDQLLIQEHQHQKQLQAQQREAGLYVEDKPFVMDHRGPFAPALAAYPYKVRYWHEMWRYMRRTWKRLKWALLFLVVSWLPIIGPLAFPVASFLSTIQAIGSKPLAAVFALMSFMLPRSVSVYLLKGFFGCRALTRELLDPYFIRLGMTHYQKRKWFNYRKSVLLGFGVVFYIGCSVPLVGVAIFGLAQASSAFVLQSLADPPPPPVPIVKSSSRSSSSSSLSPQAKNK
ncbi:hypothetical protein BGW41_002214 [Actinomortierella wolfii]|nr:hypothetical protein BGW41_002214 [Actinomortierella wolfii]